MGPTYLDFATEVSQTGKNSLKKKSLTKMADKKSSIKKNQELNEADRIINKINDEGPDNDGVIMMSLRDIFRQIELDSDSQFTISCSFLEIYNDSVYDLLRPIEQVSEVLQVTQNNVNKN